MNLESKAPTLRIAGRTGEDGAEIEEIPRRLRADAQRNRERLMVAAKTAFADVGPDVSLEEIARRAGVGIGTLYRHFPTRDAIVEAVYRREVQQLADAATRLLGSLPAAEALHQWMRLFVDYIATKKVMVSALDSIVDGTSELYDCSRTQITAAISLLVDGAARAGDIRPGVDPNDVLRGLAGFTYGNTSPGWQESALRLIDILMDGLRVPCGAD